MSNAGLLSACAAANESNGTLHVFGLLSPGGVHSHEKHIFEMLRLAKTQGVGKIAMHAFLDGRDTPPRSAADSLVALDAVCAETGARVASVSGRYYAMDRDERWERVERAWNAIAEAQSPVHFDNSSDALQAAYARGENDEFVTPSVIGDGARIVAVSAEDTLSYATNALQVNDTVLAPAGVPDVVIDAWRSLGLRVELLELPALFRKGGGAAVCLTNRLDGVTPAMVPADMRLTTTTTNKKKAKTTTKKKTTTAKT